MGNKQKKSSGGKKKKNAINSTLDPEATGSLNGNSYGMIMVDPARCRFQHSKIRSYFSGCGRSVQETLEDIKEGKTKISDLPHIQVLIGDESMDDDQGHWYFSLNNRRLWVLKRLREEGYLEKYGNKVAVRVRRPKSQQEKERYTLENCALEARLMPEKKKAPKQNETQKSKESAVETKDKEDPEKLSNDNLNPQEESGGDSDDSENNESDDDEPRAVVKTANRFANMLMDDSSSDEDE